MIQGENLGHIETIKTLREMQIKTSVREFPDGPVVKIPCLQGREHGFHPWLGNQDPICREVWPKKKKSQ